MTYTNYVFEEYDVAYFVFISCVNFKVRLSEVTILFINFKFKNSLCSKQEIIEWCVFGEFVERGSPVAVYSGVDISDSRMK